MARTDPSVVALVDQLGSALGALAPALAEYHRALLAEGFSADEALALVVSYQEWLLSP